MHQPFYNREGKLGFPCLIECFNVSRKPFVFTHQVDQMFLCIHERKTIFQRFFYKRFTGKFRQMLSKDALQNPFFAKIDEKSTYINQNNKIIIYPQYRVLLGNNFLNLISFSVTTKRLRMVQLRNNSWQAYTHGLGLYIRILPRAKSILLV